MFLVSAVPILILCFPGVGGGQRWSEEDFSRKAHVLGPYVVVEGTDGTPAASVIGRRRFYHIQKGDTFLDLARFYGLGYNEIERANAGVDPWIAPENQVVVLPTEWVLPQVIHEGVAINIPEMRLYYFHPRRADAPLLISTYPVGLGRDDWRTPKGKFRISGKTKNPTWVIPESIRQERIAESGNDEKSIPGGDPRNPLGKYRLELDMHNYRIHGTNIPWGVGMQVSHGCIRLYPEDIEQLFPMVSVGNSGAFIYQPVKVGSRQGRIYAEVHPDIYTQVPGLFTEARRIVKELGWQDRIDERRLQRAVEEQTGVPLDITLDRGERDMPEEDLRRDGVF